MSKMRALLVGATAAGALAAASFIPAQAEEVVVPGVGSITVEGDANGGSITAQGAPGWIQASGDLGGGSVCADDNGDPGESASPTCAP